MKHGFTGLFGLIGILILVAGGFGQNPAVPKKAAQTIVAVDLIKKDIAEALSVIENNYGSTKRPDQKALIRMSIEGMLETLDPHSHFLDAEEGKETQSFMESELSGIGVTIRDLDDEKGQVIGTYVLSTSDKSPAHAGGLRYGDKIIEVDGVSMLRKRQSAVTNKIRGPRGTKVKITVERLASGKRETIEIVRANVFQPSIGEAYMIRPGVGYMQMHGGFKAQTYNEFRFHLESLKKMGMTRLVLDLRNNGGGYVFAAWGIASHFLSNGQVVLTQKGRRPSETEDLPVNNEIRPEKMPVVVMVNGRSASASELLAGALQDHDRALIVGEKTFGKGLIQTTFTLDDESVLQLTTGKYLTPSGRPVQRDFSNGIYNYRLNRVDDGAPAKPKRTESKTDLGRVVYGSDGIEPDVVIKPKMITGKIASFRRKLNSPVFAFAMELMAGRVKGFEGYKYDQPINFINDIKASDLPVSADLIQAFKSFAADKYYIPAAQIDAERDYVSRQLRYQMITAAYGSVAAQQILDASNDQIQRAVELLPEAKKLFAERLKLNPKSKPK